MNSPQTGVAGFEGPASVLDAQVDAMSQRVNQDRDQRCAQLHADVMSQVQAILHSARREARTSVRDAVSRERKQGEQALRQAQAKAQLEGRQRDQQQARTMLEEMWAALAGVLETRWAEPLCRNSWLQSAIRQAQILLGDRVWRIEYGTGWSPEALNELHKLVPHETQMLCDLEIRAGIRIKTEGACLDATVAGLLASRQQIESEFLAQLLALS